MKNLLSLAQNSSYTSTDLIDGLEMVITENCNRLYEAALRNDPEHQEMVSKREAIFGEICDKLGEEHRRLAEELATQNSYIASEELELTYIQGYIDCAALLRLIQII